MKILHIVLIAIFIVAMAGIAPVAADLTVVPQGGVVFVGEEGLTFTGIPSGTTLEWFAPGDDVTTASPSAFFTAQGAGNEVIDPATFRTRAGNWYTVVGSPAVVTSIINVQLPSIDVKVYDTVTGRDMSNGRVVKDTKIVFRLDNNLYQVVNQRLPALQGQNTDIKVVVVDPEGTIYTALVGNAGTGLTSSLTDLAPTSSQFYLPDSTGTSGVTAPNWDLESSQYKTGLYTFYAEVNLNNIKDNVGTVTGVTKSAVKTLEVSKDDVKIGSNKDIVVRNNDFAVTITGRPNEYYVLWVKGTNNISAPETTPYIKRNQQGIYLTDTPQGDNAGLYQFFAGQSVHLDVCQNDATTWSAYYAMVQLSSSGTRTVGFDTGDTTKNQTYTIRTDHIPFVNATNNPAMAYVAAIPTNDTVRVTVGDPAPEPPAPFHDILTLKKGWNLISTPVNTPNIDITGYLYETIYAYNAATGTYEEVSLTDIVPGEGYWIGAFADAEIEFTGTPVTKYQKNLATGWNLVGGIGIETDIRSINMNPKALSGPIYYYNTRTHLYSQATSLEPGQGYWISTSEPCTINVNITPPAAPG